MDDLSVLPVILIGNVRKGAQSVCVTIRGCLAVSACTILYSSLKRYLFRVLRRRNDAHFLVRDDAKILGEAMGSVLKGRTEIGIIGD